MTKQPTNTAATELTTLLGNLVHNSEGLVQQQLELFQSEVRQELHKAAGAAVSLSAGAGLLAAGGLLSTVMLVHLLQRATRLPLWACYGLVSGGAAVAGAKLLAEGRRAAADVQLGLPQSTEGLKENLTWLKEQLKPTP